MKILDGSILITIVVLVFVFFPPKQANLVAAFEQSLSLMTTRLQSLSLSHNQKVPTQHLNTHKLESQLHFITEPAGVLHTRLLCRRAAR